MRLSVIVITYNHGRYIKEALESVFRQDTDEPFEVIVADDASVDDTRGIVAEFVQRYPGRIQCAYQATNTGDDGVTNVFGGLAMCRGEYIAMLDGDDYWIDDRKLRKQVAFLDAHPEYTLAFHNCRIEYEDGQTAAWNTVRIVDSERVTTDELLQNAMVQTSTIVMQRTVVDELKRYPAVPNDWFIGIVASRSGPIAYLDDIMSVFRQHTRGTFQSVGRARQWEAFLNVYEALVGVLGPEYRDTLQEAICVRSYLAALEYEKQRDFRSAEKRLTRAMQGRPEWFDPYCACYGTTGVQLLASLPLRTRLYRMPLLFRLWIRLQRARDTLGWWATALGARLRAHLRLSRGKPVGYIAASPNPAYVAGTSGSAGTNLHWSTSAPFEVEVRLARPDGPLISRTGAAGGMQVHNWIRDGTVFFLQEVSGDGTMTRRNTLDVVRVRVASP